MADLPLVNGQRIAVVGDSYTSYNKASWPDFVFSYLILRNPSLLLHLQQVARSGESVAGMFDANSATYSKYAYPLEPDTVICYTLSNGGYSKATYKGYQTTLINDYIIGLSAAEPILLGASPEPYFLGAGTNPNITLYVAADSELSTELDPNITFADLNTPLRSVYSDYTVFSVDSGTDVCTATDHGFAEGDIITFYLSGNPVGHSGITNSVYYYARDVTTHTFKVAATLGGAALDLTSGAGSNYVSNTWPRFRFAPDDVHPSRAKGIVDAYTAITLLGWGTDVSLATINASSYTLTSQTDCSITNIAPNAGGISFSRLDEKLEWAIDEVGRADAEISVPAMVGWQNRGLTVTGLAAGNYNIYEDGVLIGTKTSAELAAGINLTLLRVGPTFDQVQEVLGRIRDMHGVDRTTLIGVDSPARYGVHKYRSSADSRWAAGDRGATLIANLSSVVAEIDAYDDLIHTAAQPVNRSYLIQEAGFSEGLANRRHKLKPFLIRR